MNEHHVTVGIALLVGTILFLGWRYFRHARQRLPAWGWLGLVIILSAEILLFVKAGWFISVYFTPIVWTGYILLADGLVNSLGSDSRLMHPREFAALAFWSIPLWLIFEAYNLRLVNWSYVGMPMNPPLQAFGYAWAFATIWPAIFETADLVQALGLFQARSRPRPISSSGVLWAIAATGLALVAVPVLLPAQSGSYLFGAVWVGFVLLLDPLNYRWRGESLLRDFEAGENTRLYCFLAAGWVCGILWEFWNYWAGARWLYIFHMAQHWKIFEMPAPGFTGFPPFAVECFVMFETLRTLKRRLGAPEGQPKFVQTEV
jgi:hypothetical protein